MKVKVLLISALVTATAWVSCTDTNEQEIPAVNVKKSISFTIANQSASLDSRTVDAALTSGEVPVASPDDLYALFAEMDGTLVGSPVKIVDAANEDITVDGETYTFHMVDADVAKVVITNVATALKATRAAVAATKSLEEQQGALGNNILVYGESGTFEYVGVQHIHDGVSYNLYDAGEVKVVPLLARIEITNIQCVDLNSATPGANGLPPRFGKLELGYIGIHNTLPGIGASPRINYHKSSFLDPMNPALDEDAEADAAALAAWMTARPTAWNTDAIAPSILLDEGSDIYDDEVFVYNVVPGAVPNIILEITGGDWNSNLDSTSPLTRSLEWPYFVRSTGLQGITSFVEGTIYQVNLKFNSSDVKTWSETSDLVCVEVQVTIPNWVIRENLTPTYQ
jgi:hypothetical protein